MTKPCLVAAILAGTLASAADRSGAEELPAAVTDAVVSRDYVKALAAAKKAGATPETVADLAALAAAKGRVISGVAAGRKPAVSMDFMGRPMRGKVKAADAEGITVDLRGMTRKFKWGELSDKRFYSVVRRFAEETPAAHLALARVCVRLGLAESAERELLQAGPGEGAKALRARVAALSPATAAPKRSAGGRAAAAADRPRTAERDDEFKNVWVHAGKTSAVIYWQRKEISTDALSCVEYVETTKVGELEPGGAPIRQILESDRKKTPKTRLRRWAHAHRLTGLRAGVTYSYCMVLVDGDREIRSSVRTFETKAPAGAVELKPAGGGTVSLDRANTTYLLASDWTADGTAFKVTAANVTLEMDGHKVVFSAKSDARCFGVLIEAPGAKILGGVVEQGKHGGQASYAIGSIGRAEKLEVSGMHVTVNRRSSYPMAFINRASDVEIHHNYCWSDVVALKSRHYPGNDLLRVDTTGTVKIHHNMLFNGPHRGVTCFSKGGTTHVYENEIATDQGYVNGYTINCGDNMKIHRNRITSCGRGMHVTKSNIEIYENWMSTTQHQVYDDRPQGSTSYRHYYTENHGIKLESPGKNVKIHHNYVQSTQPQPEPNAKQRFSTGIRTVPGVRIDERSGMKGDRDHYASATPLNFHSGKSSDVEIFKNTFVAVTTYRQSKQGRGYGISGEWAATIRSAGSFGGKLHIHDNVFKSNDIFINARELSSGVVIEKNKFILLPNPTTNHRAVNGSGAAANALRSGGNTFEGQQP